MSNSDSLFCYGTLMSPKILYEVMDQSPLDSKLVLHKALLYNYKRTTVKDAKYPAATESSSSFIQGVLITGLSERDLGHLDFYEGYEFLRRKVFVEKKCRVYVDHNYQCELKDIDGDQLTEAQCYVWVGSDDRLVDEEWNPDWMEDDDAVEQYLDSELA